MAWWNEGLMACLSETTWIADLPVAWDGTSREGNGTECRPIGRTI